MNNDYILIKNKISFENKIEFTLSSSLINEYSLKEKKTLTREEYFAIVKKAMKDYTIYLLSKRDYFKKDLEDKLFIKYREKKIVLEIVEEMEKQEYLDDYNMSKQYINSHKKYGRRKLEFELKRKKIENSIIDTLLKENTRIEIEEIEKKVEKMKKQSPEKIYASLMRRGFQYKDIKDILERRK
ncbi:MAG: regulatory protein RecX [Fusobacteriaceae bacterium]